MRHLRSTWPRGWASHWPRFLSLVSFSLSHVLRLYPFSRCMRRYQLYRFATDRQWIPSISWQDNGSAIQKTSQQSLSGNGSFAQPRIYNLDECWRLIARAHTWKNLLICRQPFVSNLSEEADKPSIWLTNTVPRCSCSSSKPVCYDKLIQEYTYGIRLTEEFPKEHLWYFRIFYCRRQQHHCKWYETFLNRVTVQQYPLPCPGNAPFG